MQDIIIESCPKIRRENFVSSKISPFILTSKFDNDETYEEVNIVKDVALEILLKAIQDTKNKECSFTKSNCLEPCLTNNPPSVKSCLTNNPPSVKSCLTNNPPSVKSCLINDPPQEYSFTKNNFLQPCLINSLQEEKKELSVKSCLISDPLCLINSLQEKKEELSVQSCLINEKDKKLEIIVPENNSEMIEVKDELDEKVETMETKLFELEKRIIELEKTNSFPWIVMFVCICYMSLLNVI
jgi:hypothetical protein